MKRLVCEMIAMLMGAAELAGCGTIQEESAMQWMERQPVLTDDWCAAPDVTRRPTARGQPSA